MSGKVFLILAQTVKEANEQHPREKRPNYSDI